MFLRNLISNPHVKMNSQEVKWSGVIHARTFKQNDLSNHMFFFFAFTMQAKVCEDMFAGYAKECQIEVWKEFLIFCCSFDYRTNYVFLRKAN